RTPDAMYGVPTGKMNGCCNKPAVLTYQVGRGDNEAGYFYTFLSYSQILDTFEAALCYDKQHVKIER
ncbi:MAG: hypothetical protein RR055_06990, partial [Oscillospiraceae bacterium]